MVAVEVENRPHLLDGLAPAAPALDANVLVEQRAVQPLDDAIRLRPLSLSTASMAAPWASKVGSTSASSSCTAVTGSLLGSSRAQA